jgi:hypothetical protein
MSIFSIFARRFRDGKIEDKETISRVAVTHLTMSTKKGLQGW